MHAPPQATVDSVKAQVAQAAGIAPHRQRLIWNGRELQDHVTLSDAGAFVSCAHTPAAELSAAKGQHDRGRRALGLPL